MKVTQIVTIRKRYGRKISYKFQSEDFMTELEKTIDFGKDLSSIPKEEWAKYKQFLVDESTKLAKQVKALTEVDVKENSDLYEAAFEAGDLDKVVSKATNVN